MVATVTQVLPPAGSLVRNASTAATELIRRAIVEGRLEPGRRLKEQELARELGISRTPIREALLTLQAEELVVATPNRGAWVRERDAEDLDDLYRLRGLLEGHAARLAAEHADAHGIELLAGSCRRFEALHPADMRGLVRENLFFHNGVVELAASARLAAHVRRVIELPLVYNAYRWYSAEQKRTSARRHREILDAIAAADPDAAERGMREHVLSARDALVACHHKDQPS